MVAGEAGGGGVGCAVVGPQERGVGGNLCEEECREEAAGAGLLAGDQQEEGGFNNERCKKGEEDETEHVSVGGIERDTGNAIERLARVRKEEEQADERGGVVGKERGDQRAAEVHACDEREDQCFGAGDDDVDQDEVHGAEPHEGRARVGMDEDGEGADGGESDRELGRVCA